MTMAAHAMFPTLIGEWTYEQQPEFKEKFFTNLHKHCNSDGFTGEVGSHHDPKHAEFISFNIHHNPEFTDFFSYVSNCAREYVDKLRVDVNMWNFNLIKTWIGITDNFAVPVHNHSDAHLAFVYYVNIPDTAHKAPIHFVSPKPNDLTGNMFHTRPPMFSSVIEWNIFNSITWNWEPVEGMLMMFPSKLNHYTKTGVLGGFDELSPDPAVQRSRRIAIAGDFLLTYKKPENISYGIQPTESWRIF